MWSNTLQDENREGENTPKIKFIGYETRPGWKGYAPFFETTCPEPGHGVFKACPRGRGYLRCPIKDCFWEIPAPFSKTLSFAEFEALNERDKHKEDRLKHLRERLSAYYREMLKTLNIRREKVPTET